MEKIYNFHYQLNILFSTIIHGKKFKEDFNKVITERDHSIEWYDKLSDFNLIINIDKMHMISLIILPFFIISQVINHKLKSKNKFPLYINNQGNYEMYNIISKVRLNLMKGNVGFGYAVLAMFFLLNAKAKTWLILHIQIQHFLSLN